MIQKSIYRAFLLAVVVLAVEGLTASGASAKAFRSPTVEGRALTATTTVKTWESKPLTRDAYIHVYVRGVEIPQAAARPCSARYVGRGVYVRVTVRNCETAPSAAGNYFFRYVSIAGERAFRIRLTRSPLG